MGLLAALDFHRKLQAERMEKSIEVEYRLYSWGEIYPPFSGNREHSDDARYILNNFPFKLFSSSAPYGPLPQKLCLIFKVSYQIGVTVITSDGKIVRQTGVDAHEVAKEFAAFLSLVTRRRVFCGKQTRYDGLPIEEEADLYQRAHFQERQRLKEITPEETYHLLDNLENLHSADKNVAEAFILAMRLYHSAAGMMYTEPEFSYLFLIMCLETISSVVNKDYKPNEEEFLDRNRRGWRSFLDPSSQERNQQLKKILLMGQPYDRQRVLKFLRENVPDRFWSETKDDAKPDCLSVSIENEEKIEKGDLERVVGKIYSARSKLIHKGIRLPASIVVGLFRKIPADASTETIAAIMKGARPILQLPPLITLERLVSYSMVEFLRGRGSPQQTGSPADVHR